LEYIHQHAWGTKDEVAMDYRMILNKNSKIKYVFKNLLPIQKKTIKTHIELMENSHADFEVSSIAKDSEIRIEEVAELLGKNSAASLKLKLVGEKNSEINAASRLIAKAEGRGHLDCRGLLLSKTAYISLIPELRNENPKAVLTHEASIGKISEEELNYLRARGLSEKEAIDLIVRGFLEQE
jgi:hypothetical protein